LSDRLTGQPGDAPAKMKFTVSKTFSFEAAHSLPHLPVGHKCRHIHGHSYVVEVFCTGPLDARGFVIDYAEISAAMKPIVAQLDHQNLNDILPVPTTAENVGRWILEQLDRSPALPAQLVTRVDVHETARTCVRVER
jgi:6-pyruvoyltetrahydropterin/6-carboxytetrahydropterin synthase